MSEVGERMSMDVQLPAVDDVVRIREWASKTFGGCLALVKSVAGREVEVEVMAPSMVAFEGTFRFDVAEVSLSREDWP